MHILDVDTVDFISMRRQNGDHVMLMILILCNQIYFLYSDSSDKSDVYLLKAKFSP